MYFLQPSSQLIPQSNAEIMELDKKLDKDRIFTSTRNPRRVSEAICSFKLIPRAIYTLFLDRHTIPTPLRDRHTISAKQQLMSLNQQMIPRRTWDALIPLVVPLTPTRCAQRFAEEETQQPPLRNPPNWRRLDAAGETTNTTGTVTNRKKQSTHKFNEVRQRAYVLGARGERSY